MQPSGKTDFPRCDRALPESDVQATVAELMRLDGILREGRKRRRTVAPTSESSLAAEQDRNLAWERRLTEAEILSSLAETPLRAEKDLAWERRRLTDAEI